MEENSMPIRHAVLVVTVLPLLVAGLTGCKHYWGKPGATAEQFNRDSTECAKRASPAPGWPPPTPKDSEKIYKACMRASGWARDEKPDPPGEGWFRGIESWE
jgi:hypothetical protein